METNWKPGDIAICVKTGKLNGQVGHEPPLRLKAEYFVNAVRPCDCGRITLDVGLGLSQEEHGVKCACGGTSSPKSGIWWCASERFIKKRNKEEEIEEALANEDYELATKLRDAP